MSTIRRGDVVKFTAPPQDENSNVIRGYRPWLVVQNDIGNAHSSTTVVVPLTGHMKRLDLPTHVPIIWSGMRPSTALCEQVCTVDIRESEWNRVCTLPVEIMDHVDNAIRAVFVPLGGDEEWPE